VYLSREVTKANFINTRQTKKHNKLLFIYILLDRTIKPNTHQEVIYQVAFGCEILKKQESINYTRNSSKRSTNTTYSDTLI